MCVGLHPGMVPLGTHRDQKRASDAPELVLHSVVSAGNGTQISVIIKHSLKLQAISPAPLVLFQLVTLLLISGGIIT